MPRHIRIDTWLYILIAVSHICDTCRNWVKDVRIGYSRKYKRKICSKGKRWEMKG